MNMIKHYKEDMNKSINEIHRNINRGMKNFQDMKVEAESVKRAQAGGKLEIKNVGTLKKKFPGKPHQLYISK